MWGAGGRRDDAGMDRPDRRLLVLTLIAAALVAALLWPHDGQASVIGRAPESTGRGAATVAATRDGSGSPASTVAEGLRPGLEHAVTAAMAAASERGHSLSITSGFRTAAEQERLLAEAIDEHGSEDEALRWVFEPERSMHVKGLAVDMGDRDAAAWLEEHGAQFGLCRTLSWEWWHFEWRDVWEATSTCPAPVDDPSEAPSA
jgi:hypothetical protein